VRSFQVPSAPGTFADRRSGLRRRTSRATLCLIGEGRQGVGHVVDGFVQGLGFFFFGDFSLHFTGQVSVCFRSPLATASHTLENAAHCSSVAAMKLTVRSDPSRWPATPGTCGRLAPACLGADLAPPNRSPSPRGVQLVHIVLNGVFFFSSRISPFTSTVILRDRSPRSRGCDFGDVGGPGCQWAANRLTLSVRSFQCRRRRDHCLAAEASLGADFARHARHFGGERARCSTMVFKVSVSSRFRRDVRPYRSFSTGRRRRSRSNLGVCGTCAVRFDAH